MTKKLFSLVALCISISGNNLYAAQQAPQTTAVCSSSASSAAAAPAPAPAPAPQNLFDSQQLQQEQHGSSAAVAETVLVRSQFHHQVPNNTSAAAAESDTLSELELNTPTRLPASVAVPPPALERSLFVNQQQQKQQTPNNASASAAAAAAAAVGHGTYHYAAYQHGGSRSHGHEQVGGANASSRGSGEESASERSQSSDALYPSGILYRGSERRGFECVHFSSDEKAGAERKTRAAVGAVITVNRLIDTDTDEDTQSSSTESSASASSSSGHHRGHLPVVSKAKSVEAAALTTQARYEDSVRETGLDRMDKLAGAIKETFPRGCVIGEDDNNVRVFLSERRRALMLANVALHVVADSRGCTKVGWNKKKAHLSDDYDSDEERLKDVKAIEKRSAEISAALKEKLDRKKKEVQASFVSVSAASASSSSSSSSARGSVNRSSASVSSSESSFFSYLNRLRLVAGAGTKQTPFSPKVPVGSTEGSTSAVGSGSGTAANREAQSSSVNSWLASLRSVAGLPTKK